MPRSRSAELIALLEYCLAVPANRLGFGVFTGFQLNIIQEAITVAAFIVFAITFLKEKMAWNYAVPLALLIAAIVVAFAFKPRPGDSINRAHQLAHETACHPFDGCVATVRPFCGSTYQCCS
jgi:hypothetical protein